MKKKEVELVDFFFTGGVCHEGTDYGPGQPGGQRAKVHPFYAAEYQARGKGEPYDAKKHKAEK